MDIIKVSSKKWNQNLEAAEAYTMIIYFQA